MTTEPVPLPDDPPSGWSERKGALRFYGEHKFDDGVVLCASATVKDDTRVYEAGEWSSRFTVRWRVTALIDAPVDGVSPGSAACLGEIHYSGVFEHDDLVGMKAHFSELSSRFATKAVAQLRAAMAAGV